MRRLFLFKSVIVFSIIAVSMNISYGQEIKNKGSNQPIKVVTNAKEAEHNNVQISVDENDNSKEINSDEDNSENKHRIKRSEYNSLPPKKKEAVDNDINNFIIEE